MVDSPLWQLEGTRLEDSPDGTLALQRVERSPHVLWAALGLDVDAQLTRPVQLLAAAGTGVEIELAAPAPDQQAVATFRLGGPDARRSTAAGTPRTS